MSKIIKELKSMSGAVLMLTVLLIATFFIWNYLSSKNLGPVSSGASWVAGHANGTAYSGGLGAATPANVSYMGAMN